MFDAIVPFAATHEGGVAMSKTLFSVLFLVIIAIVANFLIVLVLNVAGLPGAMLAGKPGARGKSQFIAGSLVSAVGQSVVYLGYTAFVVNWTKLSIEKQGISPLLWLAAFLTVVLPIWLNLTRARLEAKETPHANPQTEALHITALLALIGFFVFAFVPVTMNIYGWLPYMKHS